MSILEKQGKSITSFNYNNKEIADHIYSAINSTQFLGISVSFQIKIHKKNL
jgi:gamma-aminobutyric acid type B receptor